MKGTARKAAAGIGILVCAALTVSLPLAGCSVGRTRIYYTVLYDRGNIETDVPVYGWPEQESVLKHDSPSVPGEIPTAEGYLFDAWYTTSDAITQYDFTTAINSHTTIYAHWIKVDAEGQAPEPEPGPEPEPAPQPEPVPEPEPEDPVPDPEEPSEPAAPAEPENPADTPDEGTADPLPEDPAEEPSLPGDNEGTDTEEGEEEVTISAGIIRQPADIILFAGQSNMAGRGEYTGYTGITASVAEGHGYAYDMNTQTLGTLAEPFGATQNGKGTGYMSESSKSGSMVSAFAESYYAETGRPVVAVSASQGGAPAAAWTKGGAYCTVSGHYTYCNYYQDTLERLSGAVECVERDETLTLHGVYIVWLQGESDGALGTPAAEYIASLDSMYMNLTEDLQSNAGRAADHMYVIPIGTFEGSDAGTAAGYDAIREAQVQFCSAKSYADIISLGMQDLTSSGTGHFLKPDNFHVHLTQPGYELLGRNAGSTMGRLVKGQAAIAERYDFRTDTWYVPMESVTPFPGEDITDAPGEDETEAPGTDVPDETPGTDTPDEVPGTGEGGTETGPEDGDNAETAPDEGDSGAQAPDTGDNESSGPSGDNGIQIPDGSNGITGPAEGNETETVPGEGDAADGSVSGEEGTPEPEEPAEPGPSEDETPGTETEPAPGEGAETDPAPEEGTENPDQEEGTAPVIPGDSEEDTGVKEPAEGGDMDTTLPGSGENEDTVPGESGTEDTVPPAEDVTPGNGKEDEVPPAEEDPAEEGPEEGGSVTEPAPDEGEEGMVQIVVDTADGMISMPSWDNEVQTLGSVLVLPDNYDLLTDRNLLGWYYTVDGGHTYTKVTSATEVQEGMTIAPYFSNDFYNMTINNMDSSATHVQDAGPSWGVLGNAQTGYNNKFVTAQELNTSDYSEDLTITWTGKNPLYDGFWFRLLTHYTLGTGAIPHGEYFNVFYELTNHGTEDLTITIFFCTSGYPGLASTTGDADNILASVVAVIPAGETVQAVIPHMQYNSGHNYSNFPTSIMIGDYDISGNRLSDEVHSYADFELGFELGMYFSNTLTFSGMEGAALSADYLSASGSLVTLDTDAGVLTVCKGNTIYLPVASYITAPEGQAFEGWYLDAECTKPAGTSVAVYEDTQVYAKWTPAAEE